MIGALGVAGDGTAQTGEMSQAIIEQRAGGRQLVVSAGDAIEPGFMVVKVIENAVTVRTPTGEESIVRDLRNAGSGSAGGGGAASAGQSASAAAASRGAAALGGKQIGPLRWEFSRSGVLDYYRELVSEPERLLTVFDSLHPLYDAAGKIEGYRLQVEGEPDFFKAVGLQPGDVVRSVNGLPMTNRRRAEMFIRRVVQEGLDTIALEVDRNGQTYRQVYQTTQ
jgi:type II secretory pathway component PulC